MSTAAARTEWAELPRTVAEGLNTMADALAEDDTILGALAGITLSESLPLLPKHIRDTIADYLDDEAARSAKADLLYLEQK